MHLHGTTQSFCQWELGRKPLSWTSNAAFDPAKRAEPDFEDVKRRNTNGTQVALSMTKERIARGDTIHLGVVTSASFYYTGTGQRIGPFF